MSKEPLVSVLIPNYNYGHYLTECFESLLRQTYKNFEVIFRDNNSTDNSYDIALSYIEKFKARGIYLNVSRNKRNVGSDMNTNLASNDAEGEYIYTLASDDMIKPDFLSKVMNVFIKYPNVSTVITHRDEIDENGVVTKTLPFYNKSCIIKGEDQAAVYMMSGIAIPAQRMIRLSAFNETKQYARIWNVAGDWYVNYRAAMVGDVAYIKEPLVQYRVHTGNETNVSEKNLVGIFDHYQLINSFVEIAKAYGMEKPIKRYDEAVKKLGSMCLRYALKMLKNGLNDVAKRYLLLAPVFDFSIVDDDRYIRLFKYTKDSGNKLMEDITEYERKYNLERKVSYDPPEDFIYLDI